MVIPRSAAQHPLAASELGVALTANTIETHLRSVFRWLEIRSRSQPARALWQRLSGALLTENLTDAP